MTVRSARAARALASAWMCAVALAVASAPAEAATITVNTFAQFDAAKCTLANAINTANGDANVAGCVRVGGLGADTIVLATGTYTLTSADHGVDADLTGLPDVTSDITILGNGATIARTNGDAGPFFRIFGISAGTLTLVELTVTGGRIKNGAGVSGVNGGGINVTGTGSLTLNTVTVRNNHLGPSTIVAYGGGIAAKGTGALRIVDSVVADNTVTANPNGPTFHSSNGGGIGVNELRQATITRTRITGNVASAPSLEGSTSTGAGFGGGLAATNTHVGLSFVTLSGNTARGGDGGPVKGIAAGGGVYHLVVSESPAPLIVSDCTFDHNSAVASGGPFSSPFFFYRAGGGGLSYSSTTPALALTIQRAAFIGNTVHANGTTGFTSAGLAVGGAIEHTGAASGAVMDATFFDNVAMARPATGGQGGIAAGGAIGADSSGSLFLRNVTMTSNSGDAPDGGTAFGGGIATARARTLIENSIVIGNGLPNNCSVLDGTASFASLGHNINPGSGSCGAPVASDKPNVDPQFGALIDFGHPAGQYLPLLAGSPALDSGSSTCTPIDQLGQNRVGTCDIGAAERVPASVSVAAVLPSTRAGQLGTKLTAFVTVINAGPSTAFQVGIDLLTPVPALFAYQTTNAFNVPVGTPNTPIDIAPNTAQTFVVIVTPTAAFPPTELVLGFTGPNSSAASVVGLNTLQISASVPPVPDVVALVATLGNDGIVDIPAGSQTGIFALATMNLGATDIITVGTDTGASIVPITTTVCPTSAVGACLQPPGPTASVQIATGATPTFAFFVTSTQAIPFDPAGTRIFIRLRDSSSVIRGGSSVAPRSVP